VKSRDWIIKSFGSIVFLFDFYPFNTFRPLPLHSLPSIELFWSNSFTQILSYPVYQHNTPCFQSWVLNYGLVLQIFAALCLFPRHKLETAAKITYFSEFSSEFEFKVLFNFISKKNSIKMMQNLIS